MGQVNLAFTIIFKIQTMRNLYNLLSINWQSWLFALAISGQLLHLGKAPSEAAKTAAPNAKDVASNTAALVDCGETFYDSGGPNGNYSNWESITTVICPENPGEFVEVNFTDFETEANYDQLTVYSGTNTWNNLIMSYSGLNAPHTISSNDFDGCLTFVFSSNGSTAASGWAAQTTCVTCPKLNNLKAELVGTNYAVISSFMSSSMVAATFEYEVGLPGFTPGTGAAVAHGTSGANEITLNGLSANTQYELYGRLQCANGEAGEFVGPVAFTTALTCGGYFYDSGGPNGNLSLFNEPTVTICPDAPGKYISVSFEEFEVTGQIMTVYSGTPNEFLLIGYYGDQIVPTKLTSSANSGCMTFITSGSTNPQPSAGWKAAVECVNCPIVNSFSAMYPGANSIELYWSIFGASNNYQWEVGPSGFMPGTGTATRFGSLSAGMVIADGLESGTNYDAYLRAYCLNGQYGEWRKASFTTLPTCGDTFYDDGGANGNIPANTTTYYTICPETPGTYISLSFSDFDLGTGNSILQIFDNNANWGSYFGNFFGDSNPGTVTATNSTGCITLVLDSGDEIGSGWEAAVTCVTCPNPHGVSLISNTPTTVDVSWEALSFVQGYFYEIVPMGSAPGAGNAVAFGNVASNTMVVSGLEPGTLYDFYIQSKCTATEFSDFSSPTYFSTQPTCGDMFFDPGGPLGDYPTSLSTTTTICPDVPGSYVQVVFTEFELASCCTELSVMDDQVYNGNPIANLTGNQLPQPITATNPSGCLTFYMYAPGSPPMAGWAATINCVTCPQLSGLTATANSGFAATLEWSPLANAILYEWEVGLPGFTPGNGEAVLSGNTSQVSVGVLGLESGTAYDVYVRAKCSASDFSTFTGPKSLTTFPTCGDVFADAGGPNADFTVQNYQSTVICPDMPGQFAQLDFTEFDMGACCSYVYIIDGTPNSPGSPQVGPFQGTSSPSIITANNNSGCLTVNASYSTLPAPGWLANVNCVDCPSPNNLTLYLAQSSSASFWWNPVGASSSYEWEIGLAGFVPGTGTAVVSGLASDVIVDVSGLESATSYEVYVRTICNANESSSFSAPLAFTTMPSCGDVFTDNGGPNGDYAANGIFNYNICPDQPNTYVTLDFTEFEVSPINAYMTIQDINQYETYDVLNPPTIFHSISPDGCVQVFFNNSSGQSAPGWSANVSCITCPPPIKLFLTNYSTTTDGASVTWIAAQGIANFEWEVGLPGFIPGTGQAVATGTSNSLTTILTGLQSSTEYEVYVRSDCGNGDFSPYSEPLKFITTPSCGEMFYDPAGPDSSYASSQFSYAPTTICPNQPGTLVEVEFLSLDIHPWEDYINVYDGPDLNAPLLSNFNGMVMPLPGPFTATNPSGCLTFQYLFNGGGIWAGWEANINCVTCPTIANIAFYPNAPSSLNWAASSLVSTYNWEVGLPGFTPGTGTQVLGGSISGTSVNLLGLAPNTEYEAYVQGVCGASDLGNWGNGISFTTTPSCGDKFYDSGGPNGNYSPGEHINSVICPEQAGQAVTLTFTSFNTEGCCDQLNITDDPVIFNGQTFVFSGAPTVPFSYTATNPTGCLSVFFQSDGSSEGTGWEADITCDGCFLPLNFSADNVTSNSVSLTWDGSPSATSYNYEIGAKGFVPGIGTAILTDNVTTSSVNISQLQAGFEYDAYVRSVCSGNSVGDFAGPVSFSTPVSCASTSYDTGGTSGDYGPNEDYYTTICPETNGEVVWLEFTQFETQECCDHLEILNGGLPTSPSLAVFSGNSLPGLVASSDASGCLTLHFTSDATTHRSGWAADVHCGASKVGEISSSKLLKITPNPASDWVQIHLPNLDGGQLDIVDVDGKLRKSASVQAGTSDYKLSLDGLSAGVYFVRWQSQSVKLVVAP